MKLLVTGGAGFIGSNFIHYIIREHSQWEITNLDKLTYAGNLENLQDIEKEPRYHFVKGDIADRDLIDSLLKQNFDVIVNFAAESHVDRSILDASEFLETNIKGTQVLLEGAKKYQVPRFMQISTDEVYGSTTEGCFCEGNNICPTSPYAASKACADLMCLAYWKTHHTPVLITRCSNNYGPYQFPEKLIPLVITNALENKPIPVYGDGLNVRDWIFVLDHCRASMFILVLLSFAVMVPASPGYLGTYEYAGFLGLTAFNVPEAMAVSVALIIHAVNFMPVIIAGFYHLWRGNISWRKVTRSTD